MKTFSEIAYKPKPEFFDQFLDELCRDIGTALWLFGMMKFSNFGLQIELR